MMKRRLVFAAAAVSLMLTVCVTADTTVTQGGTVSDADWISGTNLLRIRGEDYDYYVADETGAPLSDELNGTSYSYSNGYVTYRNGQEGINTTGAFNTDGEKVIDCVYGDIKVGNPNWMLGFVLKEADANQYDYESWFSDDYYLIDTIDVYHLTDGQVTGSKSFARDNFLDYAVSGDYIKIEDRADNAVTMYDGDFNVAAEDLRSVYDDGDIKTTEYVSFRGDDLYGIMDRDGNVVVEPEYGYIGRIEGGYAEVSKGEKEGLVDLSGNVIVPAEYDDVKINYCGPENSEGRSFIAGGYVAVEKEEKIGFVDLSGNVTMEPKYSEDILEVNGASALLKDLEGKVHILAADGTDTVLDDEKSNIYALNYGSGFLYRFEDPEGNYGVIDWHGKEVLPAQYRGVSLSGDGTLLLADAEYPDSVIFAVSYDEGAAEAAETEDAGEEAAVEEEASEEGEAAVDEEAAAEEEAPAEEGGAEEAPAEDLGALKALISSVKTLSEADLENNADSIKTLLENAVSMPGADKDEIKTILDNVKSLIESGEGGPDTVGAMLDGLLSLLG